MKRTRLIFILALLLLLVPAGVALADEQVDEGDVIDNDITLFGEDLHIKEGAIVNGDVVIFDGDVEVDGEVNGDIVVFGGGNIEFSSTASMNGECVVFGGGEVVSESLVVCQAIPVDEIVNEISAALPGIITFSEDGDGPSVNIQIPNFSEEFEFESPEFDFEPPEFEAPEFEAPEFEAPEFEAPVPPHVDWEHETRSNRGSNFFANILGAIGQSFIFGLLAMLLASAFPENLERMEAAVRSKPVAMGVVGFLTSIAVPSLIAIVAVLTAILIFVCIGIVGIPVLLALTLGLALGAFMGWVTVGKIVGERLAGYVNLKGRSLAFQTGLGTAVMTLVLGILGAIPFIPDELVKWVIVMVGLGAAALTQFGRKAYPRGSEPPVDSDKIDIVLQTLPEDLK